MCDFQLSAAPHDVFCCVPNPLSVFVHLFTPHSGMSEECINKSFTYHISTVYLQPIYKYIHNRCIGSTPHPELQSPPGSFATVPGWGIDPKNLSFIFHWWAGKHQNIHIRFVTPQKPIPKKEFTEIPLNVLHISTSIMCLFICIYIYNIYIYRHIYIHKKTCPCHPLFCEPRDNHPIIFGSRG